MGDNTCVFTNRFAAGDEAVNALINLSAAIAVLVKVTASASFSSGSVMVSDGGLNDR